MELVCINMEDKRMLNSMGIRQYRHTFTNGIAICAFLNTVIECVFGEYNLTPPPPLGKTGLLLYCARKDVHGKAW